MIKKRMLFIVVFSLLIAVMFGLIINRELKLADFPVHILWAKEFGTTGYFDLSHPLFAKLVVIIRALLPANVLVHISPLAKQVWDLKSYEISTWLLMVFSYVATALILLKRIFKEWNKEKSAFSIWITAAAVLVILLVGPVFIFTYPERMYLGYFTPNPYHNPTYILFRPFVLLAYFGVVDNFFTKWNWKQSLVTAFVIMCAILAKPNFMITFIPAIGLLILLFYMKKIRQINWQYLLLPIGITSGIVLGSQYFMTYFSGKNDEILFAPFTALLAYVPNVPLVILFGFLSILFPLLLSIFYWKENSSRISFQLVWLNFIVALLLCYLVGEKEQMINLNFSWGVMIAIFLLFVETVIIFGRELINNGLIQSIRSWQTILLSIVLALHFGCGMVYYILTLASPVWLG